METLIQLINIKIGMFFSLYPINELNLDMLILQAKCKKRVSAAKTASQLT